METDWLIGKLRCIVYLNNHPLSPRCLHFSFLPHKPCEIDELVAKIEGAWEKKDDAQKEDMQEKIQKVVGSPPSALACLAKRNPRSEAVFKSHKLFDFMHKQCYRHNN